jgi:hypothetical protein
VQRWRARIEFFTAAKGLRAWETEVEAATAEQANERAMQAFKLSRPGLKVPEIADITLRRVKGKAH